MKKLLLLAVLTVFLQGCETPYSSLFEQPKISYPPPFEEHNVRVEVEGLYQSNGMIMGISGVATNIGYHDLTACMLSFDVMDKNNMKVCDAIASTSSLKAGMKWHFQACFTNAFSVSFSEIRVGKVQAF